MRAYEVDSSASYATHIHRRNEMTELLMHPAVVELVFYALLIGIIACAALVIAAITHPRPRTEGDSKWPPSECTPPTRGERKSGFTRGR